MVSEDTDMLPYGCHTFITGLNEMSDVVTEYNLNNVLTTLGMNQAQFIDVCVLCGCDYAQKIYKIGVKKGFDMMKRFGCIEKILEHIDNTPSLKSRHPYPEDYMNGVLIARNMFLKRNPEGKDNVERLNGLTRDALVWNFQGKAATEQLTRYLLAHDIRQSYTEICFGENL